MLIEMQVTLCIVTTTEHRHHHSAVRSTPFHGNTIWEEDANLQWVRSLLPHFIINQLRRDRMLEIAEIGEISWPGARLAALKNISAHVVVPHHQDAANAGGWGNAEDVGAVDLGGGLEREVRQGLWQLQVGQCGR